MQRPHTLGFWQPKWSLAIRLGLLLVLSLSAFIQFTVVARSEVDTPLRADAGNYFSYAYNLKHFSVFSMQPRWRDATPAAPPVADNLTTPGYPLFLLAIPGLEPTPEFLHRVSLVQAGLGVLSVYLVFLISAKLTRPGWALAAAFVAAINPHLATISTYVLTESLFTFLLLAAVLASITALESRTRWSLLSAGVIWGACSLVRSTAQFLPLLFLLAAVVLPALRSYRRAAGLIFAGFLAVQAPWHIRNQVTTLDTSQPSLAANFLHNGSYPGFMYENRPETFGFAYRFDPDSGRASQDVHSAVANILENFRRQPLRYANWYLIGKPGMFLSWGIINGYGDIYTYPPIHSPYLEDPRFVILRMLALTLHWPLMLLGLGGALLVWLRPGWIPGDERVLLAARLVSATVLFAIAFHMIGAPFPRYGIPFRPLLYSLALFLVGAVVSRKSKRAMKQA